MASQGRGTAPSLSQAIKFACRAAAFGHVQAQNTLNKLQSRKNKLKEIVDFFIKPYADNNSPLTISRAKTSPRVFDPGRHKECA